MTHFTESLSDTPITGTYDVVVCGAGPAGVAAAIAAGRQGVRVLLLEQMGDVGGIATSGLMSHWTGISDGPLYQEILARHHSSATKLIDPERLRTVLFDMLYEANVTVRLYTMCVMPMLQGKQITGVITESKSGREAFHGTVIIDASGDGDIAARAGAPYVKGRHDGKMQPVTLMFKVAGVDYSRAIFPGGFESNIETPQGKIQDLGKAHLPFPAGHVLLYQSLQPGIVTVNMTNIIDIDGTNADDLTKGTYLCRKQIDAIVPFLQQYAPGFEQCYPIASAALLGVRETRHFVGEYILTEEDILAARVFEDWIVTRAHFNFDIHNVTGSGLDADGVQLHFPQSQHYTIPYGCFVPKQVEGLLLAGRNISGTHKAHSSYRVMPICVNMGQGIGTAAALAVRMKKLPRELDITAIHSALLAQGVTV